MDRKDSLRQSLVLYNQASRQLALVNDPGEYDKYASAAFSQLIPVNRQVAQLTSVQPGASSGSYCPECGHYYSYPMGAGPSSSSAPPDQDSTPSTNPADATELIRDANYFKLLESLDRASVEDLNSAAPSRAHTPEPQPQPETYSSISESAFCQGYFDKFFRVKKELGKGSRGVVYLVEHVLDGYSLGLFALKKVTVGNDHKWLEKVLSEVHFLRLLSHPNLVNYNHMWLESSSVSRFAPVVPCAFILQEYCNGGTLEDYVHRLQSEAISSSIRTRKDRIRRQSQLQSVSTPELLRSALLTPTEILFFFRDIVRGVSHLHLHQVIHRDLKPSNCLLISTPPEDSNNSVPARKFPTVLVSDFGEGQMEGLLRSGTGTTGTLEYCAPELINGSLDMGLHGPRLAQFSKRTDIFSLGMIFHFLCFSRLPYTPKVVDGGAPEDIEMLRKEVFEFKGFDINHLPLRDDLPEGVYMLLARMVSINPAERPLTEEIMDTLRDLMSDMNLSQLPPSPTEFDRISTPDGVGIRNPRASIRLISNQSIEAAKSLNNIQLIQQDRLDELPSKPSSSSASLPTPTGATQNSSSSSSPLSSSPALTTTALKVLLISIKLHSIYHPTFYMSPFTQHLDSYSHHHHHHGQQDVYLQVTQATSNLLCGLIGLEVLVTSPFLIGFLFVLHFIILGASFYE